jgi:hypothetical protein
MTTLKRRTWLESSVERADALSKPSRTRLDGAGGSLWSMAQSSDEQKQALQDEADLLRRAIPTAQSAERLKEIEVLLTTAPDDEETAIAASKRIVD